MPRFSVIVPVYNAEAFLGECLDSLSHQTYGDFEVVCVNDGSTDSSRIILGNRQVADGRFIVVDQENAGPSAARNAGIAAATGEYLCFLDADDSFEPFALERLAREIDERGNVDADGSGEAGSAAPLDAVVFGWSYFPAGSLPDRFVREHADVRDALYERFAPELLFEEMSNPYLRLAVRRDALAESGVRFDEGLRIGEDCQFLFALYPRIGAVRLVSDKLYRYRLPRAGSLMSDYKNNVANLALCDFNMSISIFADWKAAGLLDSYGAQLVRWFVRGQLYTILRMPTEQREQFCALVRELWLSSFGEAKIKALSLGEPTAKLVYIVLGCDEAGRLGVSESELKRALLDWRIAEYGAADLAVTAFERVAGKLLDNRETLLKGASGKAGGMRSRGASGQGASGKTAEMRNQDSFGQGSFGTAGGARSQGASAQGATPGSLPLVSVIVPVYNVEKYLDQALASLEAQTYHNIEILCVNDGSTDSSPAIMTRHAQRDSRIRVIDKPNGGYGAACNRGLDEARGEWIAILEPDDWVEPDMFKAMVDYAHSFGEPVDIVKTPYWRVWLPDTPQERTINCSYRGRIRPRKQPFRLADDGVIHLIIHHPSIWSALYRREFLQRCGIRFREIPGAGWADNPFLAETMCQARSIAYLDRPFYHYREETPEKTAHFGRNGWRTSIDRWHDMMDVYERLGVTAESIRRAHVRRGFTYIGLILEYHDLDAEPEVRDCVKSVFARMDDDLVFSEPNVSPGSKRLYADLKGVPAPAVNPAPYALKVLEGGLYNLANTGPAMTLDTLKGFVKSHAKREGK